VQVFLGVDIDLLFARLATASVPRLLALGDDGLVAAMEEKSVLALNGARVVECMLRLVPQVDVFRVAVRLVKHWAQSRGVYGNVMGYPGGVAYAIMVARICQVFPSSLSLSFLMFVIFSQLYPNAAANVIVSRFFSVFSRWKWPTPVLLCQLSEGPASALRVWNPQYNAKAGFVWSV
jgi:poly(A) polymerase